MSPMGIIYKALNVKNTITKICRIQVTYWGKVTERHTNKWLNGKLQWGSYNYNRAKKEIAGIKRKKINIRV